MTGPLEVDVLVAAPRETVFAYFVDAARYVRWMGNAAELEPMPGGRYRIGMRGGLEASGRFVEIDAPGRVVFTWGWNDEHSVAPGSTRVEVTLTEEDGGTRILLRHHGLPRDQLDPHRKDWDRYLDRLAVRAPGGDPGPDPHA